MIIVSLSDIETVEVDKPRIYYSAGYTVCNWCERMIERDRMYFAQRQLHKLQSKHRWHCARLCFTCGTEKRGSIVFKPFVCSINPTAGKISTLSES